MLPQALSTFSNETVLSPFGQDSINLAFSLLRNERIPLLIFLYVFIIIWSIYLLFYHPRVQGVLITYLIRCFFKGKNVSIKSFSFSFTSGTVLFAGIHFITDNYIVWVHDGCLVFRYWLTRSSATKYSRLMLVLNDLEIDIIHPSRSTLTDEVDSDQRRLYDNSSSLMHANLLSSSVFIPKLMCSMKQELLKLFSAVKVKVNEGRVYIGNQCLPHTLCMRCASSVSVIKFCSHSDNFKLTGIEVEGNLNFLRVSWLPSLLCTEKTEIPPKIVSGNYAIVECSNCSFDYIHEFESSELSAKFEETKLSKLKPRDSLAWGLSIICNSQADFSYSPWSDRQRESMMRHFFPSTDDKEMSNYYQSDYQYFVFRISIMKRSFFSLSFMNDEKATENVYIELHNGSFYEGLFPYEFSEDGYLAMHNLFLSNCNISTTMPFRNFLSSEVLEVTVEIHYPLKWNDLHTWKTKIEGSSASLYFIFAHKSFFQAFIDDWRSDEEPSLMTHVPYNYVLSFEITDMELLLPCNQYNYIDCSKNATENSFISIFSSKVSMLLTLPFEEFCPETINISYSIQAENWVLQLLLPTHIENFDILSQLKLNGLFLTSDGLTTHCLPSRKSHCGIEGFECWGAPKLTLSLTYRYYPVYNVSLKNTRLKYVKKFSKYLQNSDEFQPDKLESDVCDLEIEIGTSTIILTGCLLKRLWWAKECYCGLYQSFIDAETKCIYSLKQKRNTFDPRIYRPLHIKVIFAVHNVHAYLAEYTDGDPAPLFFFERLCFETDKSYRNMNIQAFITPLVLFSFDSFKCSAPNDGSVNINGVNKTGSLILSDGFQFRGTALYSNAGLDLLDETLEYAWLIEIIGGKIQTLMNLHQVEKLYRIGINFCTTWMEVDNDMHYIENSALPNKATPFKYELARFSLDGVEIMINDFQELLYVEFEPLRLSACNVHDSGKTDAMTLIIRGINFRQMSKISNVEWIQAAYVRIPCIHSKYSRPLVNASSQIEFLKFHDCMTKNLWFLWYKYTNCGCENGSAFIGILPDDFLTAEFSARNLTGFGTSIFSTNVSIFQSHPYFSDRYTVDSFNFDCFTAPNYAAGGDACNLFAGPKSSCCRKSDADIRDNYMGGDSLYYFGSESSRNVNFHSKCHQAKYDDNNIDRGCILKLRFDDESREFFESAAFTEDMTRSESSKSLDSLALFAEKLTKPMSDTDYLSVKSSSESCSYSLISLHNQMKVKISNSPLIYHAYRSHLSHYNLLPNFSTYYERIFGVIALPFRMECTEVGFLCSSISSKNQSFKYTSENDSPFNDSMLHVELSESLDIFVSPMFMEALKGFTEYLGSKSYHWQSEFDTIESQLIKRLSSNSPYFNGRINLKLPIIHFSSLQAGLSEETVSLAELNKPSDVVCVSIISVIFSTIHVHSQISSESLCVTDCSNVLVNFIRLPNNFSQINNVTLSSIPLSKAKIELTSIGPRAQSFSTNDYGFIVFECEVIEPTLRFVLKVNAEECSSTLISSEMTDASESESKSSLLYLELKHICISYPEPPIKSLKSCFKAQNARFDWNFLSTFAPSVIAWVCAFDRSFPVIARFVERRRQLKCAVIAYLMIEAEKSFKQLIPTMERKSSNLTKAASVLKSTPSYLLMRMLRKLAFTVNDDDIEKTLRHEILPELSTLKLGLKQLVREWRQLIPIPETECKVRHPYYRYMMSFKVMSVQKMEDIQRAERGESPNMDNTDDDICNLKSNCSSSSTLYSPTTDEERDRHSASLNPSHILIPTSYITHAGVQEDYLESSLLNFLNLFNVEIDGNKPFSSIFKSLGQTINLHVSLRTARAIMFTISSEDQGRSEHMTSRLRALSTFEGNELTIISIKELNLDAVMKNVKVYTLKRFAKSADVFCNSTAKINVGIGISHFVPLVNIPIIRLIFQFYSLCVDAFTYSLSDIDKTSPKLSASATDSRSETNLKSSGETSDKYWNRLIKSIELYECIPEIKLIDTNVKSKMNPTSHKHSKVFLPKHSRRISGIVSSESLKTTGKRFRPRETFSITIFTWINVTKFELFTDVGDLFLHVALNSLQCSMTASRKLNINFGFGSASKVNPRQKKRSKLKTSIAAIIESASLSLKDVKDFDLPVLSFHITQSLGFMSMNYISSKSKPKEYRTCNEISSTWRVGVITVDIPLILLDVHRLVTKNTQKIATTVFEYFPDIQEDPHSSTKDVRITSPSTQLKYFARINVEVMGMCLSDNLHTNLKAQYKVGRIEVNGTVGKKMFFSCNLDEHMLSLMYKVGEPENETKIDFPSMRLHVNYHADKGVGKINFKNLDMTMHVDLLRHVLPVDILAELVCVLKVFLTSISEIFSRIDFTSQFKQLRQQSDASVLPFRYKMSVVIEGIEITCRTSSCIAVRLETGSGPMKLSATNWIDNQYLSSRPWVQSGFGIFIGLGQLFHEAMDNDFSFQQSAYFRTFVSVENQIEEVENDCDVFHIVVTRPIFYLQPGGVDAAILLWLSYKNAFDYCVEQRSVLSKEELISNKQNETPPGREGQMYFDRLNVMVHLNVTDLGIAFRLNQKPLVQIGDLDATNAIVFTLDKTEITGASFGKVVLSGSFTGFCLRFAENFVATYDDWKSSNSTLIMNSWRVPSGSYEICSKAENDKNLPLWELIISWKMKGICINLDPTIGQKFALFGRALAHTGFAMDPSKKKAVPTCDNLSSDSKASKEKLRRLIRSVEKHIDNLRVQNVIPSEIEREIAKLKLLEYELMECFRKEIQDMFKTKANQQRDKSGAFLMKFMHKRTRSLCQERTKPFDCNSGLVSLDDMKTVRQHRKVGSLSGSSTSKACTLKDMESDLNDSKLTAPAVDFKLALQIHIESGKALLHPLDLNKMSYRSFDSASSTTVHEASVESDDDFITEFILPGVLVNANYNSHHIEKNFKLIRRARFYCQSFVQSISSSMMISPSLLDFIKETLELSAQHESPNAPSEVDMNENSKHLGTSSAAAMLLMDDSFFLDVMVSISIQPSTILFTCFPVSRMECELRSPAVDFIFTKALTEEAAADDNLMNGGIHCSIYAKDFMLNIYHPYCGTECRDSGAKSTLTLSVSSVLCNISRKRCDMEEIDFKNFVKLSVLLSISCASFDYDVRRLQEILSFPRAWYNKTLVRRLFLGEENVSMKNRDVSVSSDTKLSTANEWIGNWKTLVVFILRIDAINISMKMSNIMGIVSWKTSKLESQGHLKIDSSNHRIIHLNASFDSSDFFAEQGIIGGIFRIKDLFLTGKIVEKGKLGPISHSFCGRIAGSEFRLDHMAESSLFFRVCALELKLEDQWRFEDNKPSESPSILLYLFQISFDQLHMMINASTTPDILRMDEKLREFFGQQLQSSRKILYLFRSETSRLNESRFSNTPGKRKLDFNRIKKKLNINGGELRFVGTYFSLAVFHGNNFRSRQWAVFSLNHPLIEFVSEENSNCTVQTLSFFLGKDSMNSNEPNMASIYRVIKGMLVPSQFADIREWFDYAISSVKPADVPEFPCFTDADKTSPVSYDQVKEVIFLLPKVRFCLRNEHKDLDVTCSFDSAFSTHALFTFNADHYMFLHDLIIRYLSERLRGENSTFSSASNQSIGDTSQLLKDARIYTCPQGCWKLEPTIRLIAPYGSEVEPVGADKLLSRLGFKHARITIPKWLQRGIMDPSQALLSNIISLVLLLLPDYVKKIDAY